MRMGDLSGGEPEKNMGQEFEGDGEDEIAGEEGGSSGEGRVRG